MGNSMEVVATETAPEVEEEAKAKVVAVARRVNSSSNSPNMVKVNSRDKEKGSTSKNNSSSNSPKRNHHRNRPAVLSSMVIFSRKCSSSSNRWPNLLRHRPRLRLSLRNKRRANSRRVVAAVESINKNNSKSNRSSKSWRNNWPHSDPSNRRRLLPLPNRVPLQAPRARFRRPTVRSSASRRICPA